MKYKTADDRLIRVGEAYEYWKNKADTVAKFNDAKILRNMLDEVPSAKVNNDLEELIRCKDCDNYLGNGRCIFNDSLWGEDDYCSYAERRTDANR